MARYFAAYFTFKKVWRSCDVTELGIYRTEQAAMRAGLRSARQHPDWNLYTPHKLTWKRVPWGLFATTTFGRYDIREVTAEKSSLAVAV